jgi:hypothetical protein
MEILLPADKEEDYPRQPSLSAFVALMILGMNLNVRTESPHSNSKTIKRSPFSGDVKKVDIPDLEGMGMM